MYRTVNSGLGAFYELDSKIEKIEFLANKRIPESLLDRVQKALHLCEIYFRENS